MVGSEGCAFPAHLVAGVVPPCRVYLNGIEQKLVIEAHTDEGWLTRLLTHEDGSIQIKGDEFVIERIEGVVTVELA